MQKTTKPAPDLDGIKPSVFHRRWKILATLCTSLLIIMLANSSLNLALPSMATALNLSSLSMTWVVDIYPLVFASLLFTASTMADRYGRKLIMQLGLAVFLVGTLYAGFIAHTGLEVIISRAIMGLGGAMVMPTTLSIINTTFPRRERAKAIAIWSGVAGAGIALGSVVSGFLLEHFGWESVFWFASIVGIVGLICNQILTPESRDEKQTPVDWTSGALSTIGLLGLVYAIIEAPSYGFTPAVIVSGLVGIAGIATFIWWQGRIKNPMLDMKLFRSRSFSVSALAVTITFFGLMGVFFSLSQVFQLVMGYGAMESAIRLLPMSVIMVLVSPMVPNVVRIIGARWTITGGLLLVASGFMLMSLWPTVPNYFQVIGSVAIIMTGMALTTTPATNVMMSAVPRNRSGMGSAMNDTTRELGAALGVAVLGSVIGSTYGSHIVAALKDAPAQIQAVAENSLASALELAGTLGSSGDPLITAAKEAWMTGLSHAMLIAAGLLTITAIVTAIYLPHTHKEHEDDSLLKRPVTK